jgi:endo-1,4-beta-xylanase
MTTGGTATGGAAGTGPAAGSAGAGGQPTTCPLPKTFKWTSTGPLAQPKAGWASLKNFSDVVFNNQHIVYYSGGTTAGKWAGGMMVFADWADMATATQNSMPMLSAAPTLIYFTPKKIWVLMYQYGQWTFMYSTSTDPTNPSSWSAPRELYNGGGIDNTVICNSTTCYLFVTNDSGHVYRSSMPIDNFPGIFPNATTIMTDTTANLFEAEQVYAVKGTNQYLMIVEAMGGGGRYFRSFTATDLGGSWTPLAATEGTPFAGKANVTFSGNAWTSSISHGDLVRTNPDETQTIDPCNIQFLYQGDSPGAGGSYIQLPYRPGLLTLMR